jgi:hypothetical protein
MAGDHGADGMPGHPAGDEAAQSQRPDALRREAPHGDVEHRCDLCGAPMHEWHCRIICTFCGYQRDCSDP